MLRPGTCLCHICGRTSTEAYYTSGQSSVGAVLKKTAGPWPKYFLDPYIPGKGTPEDGTTIHLTSEIGEDPFPDTLYACFNDEKTPRQMVRSCPRCSVKTTLPHYMGKLPLFVLACVGKPGTGKSAWMGALSNIALAPLNDQDYPYAIQPQQLFGAMGAGGASALDSQGNSNYFVIFRKKRYNPESRQQEPEKAVALIYLLDTAGENYRSDKLQDTPLSRMVLGIDGTYTGVDGAIFFEPAVQINQNTTKAANATDATDIYNVLRDRLRQIPVAYVRTFADKLLDPKVFLQTPPLFCKSTFPNPSYGRGNSNTLARYFLPQVLRDRLALQDHISHDSSIHSTVFRMLDKENVHGFLVQSCVFKSNNGTNQNDYTQQFNVADPLIWMLNQLDLFPLVLRKGD